MCSYYTDKDILNMFPLNYDELKEEEQDRILYEISLSCNVSVDKLLEVYYMED